jgi:hypothetical protein
MTDVLQIAEAARRWLEIVDDPALSERPERIETDSSGQVIMTPPPDFVHRTQAKKIQAHLDRLFGEERAATEQPIETVTGAIKIADVVWLTQEQYQRLLAEAKLPLKPAPPSLRKNALSILLRARQKSGFASERAGCVSLIPVAKSKSHAWFPHSRVKYHWRNRSDLSDGAHVARSVVRCK